MVGAFKREYHITVAADGVAGLRPESQRATLDITGPAFARVVSSREVLATGASWQGARHA